MQRLVMVVVVVVPNMLGPLHAHSQAGVRATAMFARSTLRVWHRMMSGKCVWWIGLQHEWSERGPCIVHTIEGRAGHVSCRDRMHASDVYTKTCMGLTHIICICIMRVGFFNRPSNGLGMCKDSGISYGCGSFCHKHARRASDGHYPAVLWYTLCPRSCCPWRSARAVLGWIFRGRLRRSRGHVLGRSQATQVHSLVGRGHLSSAP